MSQPCRENEMKKVHFLKFHWFLLDLSRDYEKHWVPIFRNQRGTPLQTNHEFLHN